MDDLHPSKKYYQLEFHRYSSWCLTIVTALSNRDSDIVMKSLDEADGGSVLVRGKTK